VEGLGDGLGVAGDGAEVGAGGGVGFGAFLFPVTQGAEGDVELGRELFLSHVERAADDRDAGAAFGVF